MAKLVIPKSYVQWTVEDSRKGTIYKTRSSGSGEGEEPGGPLPGTIWYIQDGSDYPYLAWEHA